MIHHIFTSLNQFSISTSHFTSLHLPTPSPMAISISLPSIPLPPTLLRSKPPSTKSNLPFEHYKDRAIRLAERGQLDSAVKTLSSMPYQPDLVTCSVLLRSCIRDRDLHHGRAVHRLLHSSGIELDTAIYNSLITMYSKGGDYAMAYSIFSKLGVNSDLVSWASIISSAAENRRPRDALELFCKMLETDFTPEVYTFCAVIKACSTHEFFSLCWVILAFVIKIGSLKESGAVVSSLIDMFAENNDLRSARKVFDRSSYRNLVLWTQLITRYGQKGFAKEAVDLFVQMLLDGEYEPDQFTISSALSACTELESIKLGRQLHSFAIRTGTIDATVGCSLVDMYAKCEDGNSMDNARKVFDEMLVQSVVSWTALISGYVQRGWNKEALDLFNEMMLVGGVKPNAFTYSVILKACANMLDLAFGRQIHAHIAKLGLSSINFVGNALVSMYTNSNSMEEARKAFNQLHTQNMISYSTTINGQVANESTEETSEIAHPFKNMVRGLNAFTFASLLSGAARVGLLTKGQKLHAQLLKAGYGSGLPICNSLITMYSRCGYLDDACKVFSEMSRRNVISWTSMITGYAKHGYADTALEMFDEMISAGVRPNGTTYTAVLTACSHAGLVNRGKEHFNSMQRVHRILPRMEHYACMVDLLGRSGLLDEAMNFINSMPIKADALVWRTMLAACKVHGNVELGEIAAKNIFEIEPQDSAAHVLLSNLYAKAGKWDEVAKIRVAMKEQNVNKEAGISWLEIENVIHEFHVGDTCHPRAKEVYAKLDDLIREIKQIGYVPDTSCVLHDIEDDVKEQFLLQHSEKIAVAFGLVAVSGSKPIRVFKNLRVCADCHNAIKLISKTTRRDIIVRDTNRFHRFSNGRCSCGEYW
ncbi:Pentatricopeptide repeat-containing protein [Rhynchospora pubera]|uniref:Pentatricopeptide repeat-containing protein n=1 Tax=Rhynchospora pubera TaxID=906938 RepID=A0AAV8HP85_9POAL|nr:Pentatricopeptide repeat-containing protein [Rhynchospora pubera]